MHRDIPDNAFGASGMTIAEAFSRIRTYAPYLLFQPVPHSGFGNDMLGVLGALLDLAAQLAHVYA